MLSLKGDNRGAEQSYGTSLEWGALVAGKILRHCAPP